MSSWGGGLSRFSSWSECHWGPYPPHPQLIITTSNHSSSCYLETEHVGSAQSGSCIPFPWLRPPSHPGGGETGPERGKSLAKVTIKEEAPGLQSSGSWPWLFRLNLVVSKHSDDNMCDLEGAYTVPGTVLNGRQVYLILATLWFPILQMRKLRNEGTWSLSPSK